MQNTLLVVVTAEEFPDFSGKRLFQIRCGSSNFSSGGDFQNILKI